MAEYVIQKMKARKSNIEFGGFYVFIITFLEILGKTHMSVHDNNHAFIQANSNDVRFMGVHEGLQVFMQNDIASSSVRISNMHEDLDKDDAFSTSTYLKFVPPQLDFKERYLGVPHLEKVMLVNTDSNKTIHMSSVSGNTLHFHSSFFQDKTIPPKGNTSFAVVFLGRAEGQVSSSLYIHTSEGTFKYHVSGSSVGSPYRLRPLGGVRLPLNAAFQPLIHLHNPHHYPIQVVEVYSSGSEFHLELPGGEMEGPKALWEVPPYTTKPVIRAKFQASAHSNHTAYIRLKLNNSEEVLVVPMEVEVTSQPGLYSTQHYIDFGIGGSQEQPKKLKLYLCNSLKKALRIQSVGVVPASAALTADFEPVKIPPGTSPVEVAELTFDWKLGFETNQTSGKILIKSRQSQYKLVIPFSATVLEGRLKINETAARFLTSESKASPRNFTVVNEFKIPVAINNVSLLEKAAKYFQITKFKPLVIPPGKSADLFRIVEKESGGGGGGGGGGKEVKLESGLILYTNVSDITIPVLSYNGKLTKIFPRGFEDLELLDVGLVSSGSTKKIRFGLQNSNPVSVELYAISSNSAYVTPQLLGVFYGNVSAFLNEYSFAGLANSTYLKPNGIAVVELSIRASKVEEVMSAQIRIASQYETLAIPVRVSVAHGSLEMIPRHIILKDCFPGRICSQALKVQSTFNRPMTVTAIASVPPDPRVGFTEPPGGSEILPSASNYLGELRWDAWKSCGSQCYLGIPPNVTNGLRWSDSEPLPPYTCDTEATLLQDRYQRLLNATDGVGSGHWQEITLRLDTNEVREEMFNATIRMIWPRFAKASKMEFPLTQVTNTTVQRLKLYNPASHVIAVQLVMEWAYPQPKRLIDSLPPAFKPHPHSDGHCSSSSSSSSKDFYILDEESGGGGGEARGIVNATLAPGENYEVSIAYSPRVPQRSCAALFVRNNLTVVEVVQIVGEAAHAQLKFGNRKPGSSNPLMFEISEKHLKDCQREKNKKFPLPNLTVKRSFTARNVGELPIFVHKFYINGLECEGYGFSVLNCGSFELPANGTRKIDVAFTPDFTLSKVQRTLNIETSLGADVNYTLVMTLPPVFLSACSTVLSRPKWEPLLYYSAVSFMAFLLFCVLAAAFFESDRILKCALASMSRERGNARPLDLRQIGSTVLREFAASGYKRLEHGDGRHREQSEGSAWTERQQQQQQQKQEEEEEEAAVEERADEEVGEATKEKEPLHATQLNNASKGKSRKLQRRGGGGGGGAGSEGSGDGAHDGKKRDKNVSNWCNIFSRGGAAATATATNAQDKLKLKMESEAIHQIRNDIEKKEEGKREDGKKGKLKKSANKEPSSSSSSKEEEETSSTTTDSSNDAEKENAGVGGGGGGGSTTAAGAAGKGDKGKKSLAKKERGGGKASESKENCDAATATAAAAATTTTVDCDEEDAEGKERKAARSNNTWKVNAKPSRLSQIPDASVNVWKGNGSDANAQKTLEGCFKAKVSKSNNLRERKEKNVNKRHVADKIGNQKVIEHATIHHSTPCWEHRSFSEVVARNDSPALYSNIVSSSSSSKATTQAKPPQLQQSATYSEPVKASETSPPAALGPIGSKKPMSNWSQYGNSSGVGVGVGVGGGVVVGNPPQSNLFGMSFAGAPTSFMEAHGLGVVDGGNGLDDSFPIDPQNLWEDQHALMELMHQQENMQQQQQQQQHQHHQHQQQQHSWKENWPDYLWCTGRGMQVSPGSGGGGAMAAAAAAAATTPQDGYGDPSWSSLLSNTWSTMTSSWAPTTSPSQQHQRGGCSLESNLTHFGGYGHVAGGDAGFLGGHAAAAAAAAAAILGPNLNGGSLGQSGAGGGGAGAGAAGGGGGLLGQGLFPQAATVAAAAAAAAAASTTTTTTTAAAASRQALNDRNLVEGKRKSSQNAEDNLVENSLQFDPFHSFSSIWSPKAQNTTWNSPGNQ